MSRTATCQCGQLQVTCIGEPVRISACHCLACQKRTGSSFGAQARYSLGQVTIVGQSRQWNRIADSGNPVEYHFCPECGSTVWYRSNPHFDAIAVPIGAFADPDFPTPRFSVWEARRHRWALVAGEGVEHHDR